MVYVDFENEETMGYIYDSGFPNDFESGTEDIKKIIHYCQLELKKMRDIKNEK